MTRMLLIKLGVIICLTFMHVQVNAAGALFNVSAEGLYLNINTTIPNHNYPAAGIKIITKGFSLAKSGAGCTLASNGYCLFPVSHSTPAHIKVSGPSGMVQFILCLNGTSALSCQTYSLSVTAFAYVANYGNNTVSLCRIAPSGELICPGTTGSGFNGATVVAINPANTLAYVVNYDGNSVSLCSILKKTGELTCSGTTGGVFSAPSAITINPAGTFAYVSNYGGGTVSVCAVSPSTGDLINCAATGGALSFPEYITINPQNTVAYVANDNSILFATLSQALSMNGLLTLTSGISINPSATFVYVSDYYNNTVYRCIVSQSTGELTCPGTTGGGFNGPGGITINPTGTIAYVSNYDGNSISLCSIQPSTGELICPGTTGSGFSNPSALAY